jgi:hypothetical protein
VDVLLARDPFAQTSGRQSRALAGLAETATSACLDDDAVAPSDLQVGDAWYGVFRAILAAHERQTILTCPH